MISFDNFIIKDGIPIYVQIINHIKAGIAAGVVLDKDEMPSRRMLSALLGINPNTIQKAYKILEDESLIENKSGAKSFIILTETQRYQIQQQLIKDKTGNYIESMKEAGLAREKAIELINQLWK